MAATALFRTYTLHFVVTTAIVSIKCQNSNLLVLIIIQWYPRESLAYKKLISKGVLNNIIT